MSSCDIKGCYRQFERHTEQQSNENKKFIASERHH